MKLKTYEILSFAYDNSYIKDSDNYGNVYKIGEINYIGYCPVFYTYEYLLKYFTIHSVKRLSDGKIFTKKF
jgi:hypothetical protein